MQVGLKCRIDFPSAPLPLPLTVQNVGVRGSYGRADVGIGPCNNKRKSSSTFVGGGVPDTPL